MLISASSANAGTSFLIYSLYVAGLMLILSDFSQRKHYLSIIGGIVLAGGLVGILACEKDIYVLFLSVTIAVSLIMAVHLTMLYLTKRDWIDRYVETKNDTLIGQEGYTTTEVCGYGHMVIGSTNILISSIKAIEKGKRVRIIKIEGEQICVEEIDEK